MPSTIGTISVGLEGELAVADTHPVAEVQGAAAGLSLLDEIEDRSIGGYQPYWAVRGHLLQTLGRSRDAAEAFDRAIGLAEDDAVRRFLLERRG